jgi:prephenate dehydratase
VRAGYLGPPGTFCEEALLRLAGPGADLDEVPYPTVIDCFRAVREGEVPQALVPIENTLEGAVPQTLDQLASNGVAIRAEVVLPVRHHLIAREPGVRPGDLERVLSHPHATAQCASWLRANAPQAEITASNSTADAVRTVGSGAAGAAAAIGTLRAAELYGGTPIATDIADAVGDNLTRFVMVGTEPVRATGPGRFRTSIICGLDRDRPGALLAILQEFALRAVNLSKLESRPAKTGLGRYVFFIDIEGSRQRDLAVDAAITAIEEQGVARVTFLGSYPAAGPSG